MPSARSIQNENSRLVGLITFVIVVALLYFAQALLIPLALAVLLSFVLAPMVEWLERRRLGRVAPVLIASSFALLLVTVIGYIMFIQAVDLAKQLPQYRHNIREKVVALQRQSQGSLGEATESLKQVSEEVLNSTTQPETAPDEPLASPLDMIDQEPEPVPVQVVEPPPRPIESMLAAISPLLNPLAAAGIVIVFVIFILLQREDLRDRMIRLIGGGQLTVTTQAIDEAAARVSRYLLMLLIVNGSYGVAAAIGLYFIGVPNAILFGALTALLRFIPYVGPWIGAALPIIMSLAVFDTWERPLLTIGLFVVLEVISNNVIEPWLYGSNTGLSAVAVLVSAVFWTWLWGPMGLVMATPLTVCLVVIGRHVPQLEYLNVLLSDRPSLPLEARVYQRLIAMDSDEAFQLASEYLKDHTLLELYDEVLVPALAMAERDRHRGLLTEGRDVFVYRSMRELVDELGERARLDAQARETTAIKDAPEVSPTSVSAKTKGKATRSSERRPAAVVSRNGDTTKSVLCVPARDEADAIAGRMLAQLLETEHIHAEFVSADSLASEVIETINREQPQLIVVSALPPMAVNHARYLCKRICTTSPRSMLVGMWQARDLERARDRLTNCGTDRVVSSFAQAIEAIRH